MQIETERLLLRVFTSDDLDELAALYADPVVMRYYPQTYNREETQQRLESTINGYSKFGVGLLATIMRSTGEFIGRCGITYQNIEGTPLPEIGYMLHAHQWGKGYATEAATTLRNHGFTELGLDEIYSLIRPVNTPSQAVALRNGMTIRRNVQHANLDHHLFSIKRSEWLSLRV
ncbi:MAG TPA: GNAT family N-acetyltransferase [Planktothrix sp.]|jgi:ribosomal-protein-alanine N-acetyltransferase